MARFVWFAWVLLSLQEGCLAASTITRIKPGATSNLLEAPGSSQETGKSREQRGSKIYRIFRPPTQKELEVREKFKSSFIFNTAGESDSALPRKRTRKILKRMNSVTESDILRPSLKFMVNGGSVNTEYRETNQYNNKYEEQARPRVRSRKDSRKADDSGTQNVWSIEEDYPQQESSALLSTLLIEEDNGIDDFSDDTNIKDDYDYNDTTDMNINPTMNTLSAEFDDEIFEDEKKIDNLEENIHKNIFQQELDNFDDKSQHELTNLDETTVTNNLKGETLEKFDGFDRINDAKVSNQITGNNDDALEILKTVKEDYSSEDKKRLDIKQQHS